MAEMLRAGWGRTRVPLASARSRRLSRAMTKIGSTGRRAGTAAKRRDARAERLAAALKANLRRRKVQARERAAESGGAEQDAASATAHDSARVVADKRSA